MPADLIARTQEFYEQGHYAKAAEAARQAASALPTGDTQELIAVRYLEAKSLAASGRYAKAESTLLSALKLELPGPDGPAVQSAIYSLLGSICAEMGRTAEANRYFDTVQDLQDRSDTQPNLMRLETLNRQAEHSLSHNNLVAALDYSLRAQETAQKLPAISAASKLVTLTGRAELMRRQGLIDKAEDILNEAKAEASRLRPNHPERSRFLSVQALVDSAKGRNDQAQKRILKSLEIAQKNCGKKHPKVARLKKQRARIHRQAGDFKKAERSLKEALEIEEDLLDPEHPDIAETWLELAETALALDEPGRAGDYLQNAENIRAQRLDRGETLPHRQLAGLARTYKQMVGNASDPVLEEMYYRRLLAMYEQDEAQYLQEMLETLQHLSKLNEFRNPLGSKELQERALALAKDHHGADSDDAVRLTLVRYGGKAPGEKSEDIYKRYHEILQLAAKTLDKSGMDTSISGAEALFQRALEIYEKLLGPDHYEVSLLLNNYASLLHQLGKHKKAETLELRSARIRDGLASE